MGKKMSIGLFTFCGIILLIGIYRSIINLQILYDSISAGGGIFSQHFGIIELILTPIILIIPIFRIIGSLNAFKYKEVGRKVLVASSFAFFVVILIGAWRMAIYIFHHPAPPIIPEGAFTYTVSLVPSYLNAVFDIVTVFYLTRPKVKEQFE